MDCYRYSSFRDIKGVRIFTVRVESMDCYRYRSFRDISGAGASGIAVRELQG